MRNPTLRPRLNLLYLMAFALTFILALLLASCSSGPTMITANGDKINLGFSILENSTTESASATLPGGAMVTYTKDGKNQTAGVTQLAGVWGAAKAVTSWASTKNATTAANASVAKNASNNAASVANTTTAARGAVTSQAINANPAAVVPPAITPP